MIWAVLAVVISAPPSKMASTYDEAACAEAQAEHVEEAEINCSEAPPATPAVLDCNDARVSVWLGEMIGSCEMPRPLPGTTVKAPAGNDARLCRDGHCGVDSQPLRAAARFNDDSIPVLGTAANASLFHEATPLSAEAVQRLAHPDGKRLERPPRSV